MTRRSLTVAVFCLMFCAATPAAGPSPANALEGRIAYSAVGNHNDPDDWPASPIALAIFAKAGLQARLVHFDYNSILPQTNAEWNRPTGPACSSRLRKNSTKQVTSRMF